MGRTELAGILKKNQELFQPVVPFHPGKDRLLSLDFTEKNTELTQAISRGSTAFSDYITGKLREADARYGIGGYGEHRTVYGISKVFDAERPGDEPRRLHLGTDIWGKPYTPVMAPLAGIIHSFAFNNQLGDYGATIILSHALEGEIFYTLYGHLSLSSIKNLQEAERVEAGDVIAEFGIPSENGQWPPHLHFQVIHQLGQWKGDYPGVCPFSQKEKYLSNSPDPDLILRMDRYLLK